MNPNVCGIDRTVRLVLGVVLLVVGYRNRDRTLGALAVIAGSDLLATAIVRWCPANALFGIDTCQQR